MRKLILLVLVSGLFANDYSLYKCDDNGILINKYNNMPTLKMLSTCKAEEGDFIPFNGSVFCYSICGQRKKDFELSKERKLLHEFKIKYPNAKFFI